MRPSHAYRLAVVLVAVVSTLALASDVDRKSEGVLSELRVSFPSDYRQLEVIRRTNLPNKQQVGTVYANPAAATVKDLAQLPYPDGAIIVFEWADVEKDAAGAPIVGPDGLWRPAVVTDVDVMKRGAGFGEMYGEARAGEWEFARFTPDGKPVKVGAGSSECAKCHRDASSQDFVFRGRFPAIDKTKSGRPARM